MEIKRFFCGEDEIKDGVLRLDGEEFLHCTKVLRYKTGFKLIACTGDGFDNLCEITQIAKDSLTARVLERTENKTEPGTAVTLYCSLTKGGKIDFVIQKATELGITAIVPFYSKRSEKTSVNPLRLQKVALEAAKQCGRAKVPEVRFLADFKEVQKEASAHSVALMAYEDEKVRGIADIGFKGAKSVAVVVGAEGGFEPEEASSAENAGIKTVSLGKRILRAETAAVSVCTLVMFLLGEMSV